MSQSAGWIYELKYDGFRCLASKCGDVVRMESRNGNDMSDRFPELVTELQALECDLVIDGELVIVDELGRPQWERLKRRHAQRNTARIRAAATLEPTAIFVFDLLWKDGRDLRGRPLLERKAALYDALGDARRVRHAGHFTDDCAALWAAAKELGLEGIMAKDGKSVYSAGADHALAQDEDADRRGAGEEAAAELIRPFGPPRLRLSVLVGVVARYQCAQETTALPVPWHSPPRPFHAEDAGRAPRQRCSLLSLAIAACI